MTKVVSNYTNLGPTSEHSNGMNAVPGPGTMFFDHQQRHREGKQNCWHPFVHLFVLRLLSANSELLTFLFPPSLCCPLILCPPTPFGAMMPPPTHSSSSAVIIDPLPRPAECQVPTELRVPLFHGGRTGTMKLINRSEVEPVK